VSGGTWYVCEARSTMVPSARKEDRASDIPVHFVGWISQPTRQAAAVVSRERCEVVLGSWLSRRAGCGAHLGRPAQIPALDAAGGCGRVARAACGRVRLALIATLRVLHTLGLPGAQLAAGCGKRGRSRRASGTRERSARGAREAPGAAHTWAARRTAPAPDASGGGSCVTRAARGRARLAVIATSRVRHTLGPPGAHPAAGRGRRCVGRVARAARGRARLAAIAARQSATLGPPGAQPVARRGRRGRHARLAATAACRVLRTVGPPGTHPAEGRGRLDRSSSAIGTGTCSALGDCDAPDAAHTWAARRTSRRGTRQAGGRVV
jgi:hypothetical protein